VQAPAYQCRYRNEEDLWILQQVATEIATQLRRALNAVAKRVRALP
jgi:hypothetical protein